MKKLVRKYVSIKVQITSKAAHFTQAKVSTIRIKDEIKFLHMKEDLLNKKLYQIHLQAAQEWGNTWYMIRDYIHNYIDKDMSRKHNILKQKLNKFEHTHNSNPKHLKIFYPRVTNNTDTKFTTDELNLLNKGLKYNLSYKNKNWIKTLALETETALTQLPAQEKEYIRIQIAHNLKQLYTQKATSKQYNSNQAIREYRALNKIKVKLRSNDAIISKADKGNSTVILYMKVYYKKIPDFVDNDNFTILNKDPTQSFQSKINDTIKSCQLILPKASKTKLTNMNPMSPRIRGLPKVHKVEFRPIVNWRGAPAYKLPRFLDKSILLHIPLANVYNVNGPVHLIDDLLSIPYKQGIKLVSFDIENM
jgi:hypothetical protein